MAKEKSLVEEAILSMKNLEEAVAENAKGILASTMKEEIKELVKESLSEQEEDGVEDETEIEAGTDDSMNMDMGMDMGDTDDEEEDMGDEEDEEGDDEEEDDVEDEEEDAIDLTDKSDAEVLRVFKLMGPDDNIVVTKDEAGNINIKDEDKEYMIVGESIEGFELEEELDEMYDESNLEEEMELGDVESDIEDIFSEETLYELELDPEDPFMGDSGVSDLEEDMDSKEETVYEIDLGGDDLEEDYDLEEGDEFYEEDGIMESKKKMSFKAKGKVGKGPKFNYETGKGGFKTVKKTANKTMGTGNAKKGFSYDKKGENLDGEFKMKPKKMETKEASRTNSYVTSGKVGLRKGSDRNESRKQVRNEDFSNQELSLLREKNEEYRKALNVFRNKLNEVAIFNSNLAYATRLFTEHSTSKQEKINILRRFDGVETIKESKNLYQTIKDELSVTTSKGKSNVNESVERVIEKSQSTGSATNLIESKTYENPQFLRMKDLMAKIK
jgi:hypothetical protein